MSFRVYESAGKHYVSIRTSSVFRRLEVTEQEASVPWTGATIAQALNAARAAGSPKYYEVERK